MFARPLSRLEFFLLPRVALSSELTAFRNEGARSVIGSVTHGEIVPREAESEEGGRSDAIEGGARELPRENMRGVVGGAGSRAVRRTGTYWSKVKRSACVHRALR